MADLHCHPTLKPVGHLITDMHAGNPAHKSSLWYHEKVTGWDKLVDVVAGVAIYSQADLVSAINGGVKVLHVSLYPPEVSFFNNKLPLRKTGDVIENFVTGFSQPRVSEIQSPGYDYFNDLTAQYNLLRYLDATPVNIQGQPWKYILARNSDDLRPILDGTLPNTIGIVINIEGGHALGCGRDPIRFPCKPETIISNAKAVKNWEHTPFYITLAHHFYNELLGHTRSMPDSLAKIIDQTFGMESGFTPLGEKVVEIMLDKSLGKRILIDVKHMSTAARRRYYEMLDTNYAGERIPILFTHGGVNGLPDFSQSGKHIDGTVYNDWDISLFDHEIVRIARSGGIIGLNMDQRVMSSPEALKSIKHKLFNHKYRFAGLIWNNLRHIAQTLDREGLPAWDHVCIGSDFDGEINPINGIWGLGQLPEFRQLLLRYIRPFVEGNSLSQANRIDPEVVADKIFSLNVGELLKNYY